MPKTDYIEQNDDGFNAQLTTFNGSIGNYAALLGLSAPTLAGIAADAAYFDYELKCMKLVQNAAQQWTAWKNIIRDGGTPPDNSRASNVFGHSAHKRRWSA